MISYNVQPLAQPKPTGIGNYAIDVLKNLLPSSEDYELHVFDFLGRNGAPGIVSGHIGSNLAENSLHVVKPIPLSVYIRMGKLGKVLPYKKLTKSKSDLAVFFNYLAPEGLKEKSIITIYDMVCERFPETMDDRNRKLLQRHLKKSADNASAVVTISEFSKSEIIELLGVPEEKIFVAPCGTDTSFYKPAENEEENRSDKGVIKSKWDLDKYILYVGTLEPRKNTIVLVKAFDKIAKLYPEHKLVLSGGLGWHAEKTLEAIENSPFKDRIIRTGYVSNTEKRALLRNADVFVFPSIYEGFGMPVTESMACGTPCVIANTSSLPEASCNLVPAVEPDDSDGFAREISNILTNGVSDEFRTEMINSVSRFTWEKAASAYKDAINYAKGADNY